MGKYEKKKHSEFEDIQNVFKKRDSRRAEAQPEPEDFPEVPAFLNEPRRIRGDAAYSVDAMRQVHEGEAVYEDAPEYRESSSVHSGSGATRQPVYVQEPYDGPAGTAYVRPRRSKRKKHRVLRLLLRIAAGLLGLIILAGAISLLSAKMPESDRPIGPRKDGCCTVLLCGTDAEGARTDTMVLLYLDRNGRKLRLLSLPRDTMVNRSSGDYKLNGVYWANGGAQGSKQQGMDMLMDYAKDLVGFRPDGYMLLDLNCFEDLVDAMGGVRFEVPMDMQYNDPTQELYIDLKQGLQELNGKEAMWLVRFRSGYAMADLERIKVQRDFLGAAVSQWKSITRLPRTPYAALLLMKNATTDLSFRNLTWIAMTLARAGVEGLESDTLPGEPAWVKGGAFYVQDRTATAALVNEKYNPYEKEISAGDLHPYGY